MVAMNEAEAQKYLENHRAELERIFNDQFPNLPLGGFYNPRVVCVVSGDIEFLCHYNNYDNEDDGWTWFFDTEASRFYN